LILLARLNFMAARQHRLTIETTNRPIAPRSQVLREFTPEFRRSLALGSQQQPPPAQDVSPIR
jgi:hypothetical protein